MDEILTYKENEWSLLRDGRYRVRWHEKQRTAIVDIFPANNNILKEELHIYVILNDNILNLGGEFPIFQRDYAFIKKYIILSMQNALESAFVNYKDQTPDEQMVQDIMVLVTHQRCYKQIRDFMEGV